MPLKLRLARAGAKKRPFYRIVVADTRSPRDGRFIEIVGTYNPILPKDDDNRVKLKEERIQHWLGVGAQPTDRVLRFLDAAGLAKREPRHNPQKAVPGEKARERAEAAAAAAAGGGEEKAATPAAPAKAPVVDDATPDTPAEATAEVAAAEPAEASDKEAEPAEAEAPAGEPAEAEAASAEAEAAAAESTEVEAPAAQPTETSDQADAPEAEAAEADDAAEEAPAEKAEAAS